MSVLAALDPTEDPPEQDDKEPITIRLPVQTVDALRALTATTGRERTLLIRLALHKIYHTADFEAEALGLVADFVSRVAPALPGQKVAALALDHLRLKHANLYARVHGPTFTWSFGRVVRAVLKATRPAPLTSVPKE
jgi:predicted DNA-binding protein